jgi:hypothetical protein
MYSFYQKLAAKMSRPLLEVDMTELQKLMQFRPTKKDAAAFFNVSEDTIERRIRELEDLTYEEFKEKYSVKRRIARRQKLEEMAMKGNIAALIYLDKKETGDPDQPPPAVINNMNVTPETLKDLVKIARGTPQDVKDEEDQG